MAIKIGHASVDENGKSTGGNAGDQNGREVFTRQYYSSNWTFILRPKSVKIAEKSAKFVEDVCANKMVGYDQGGRNTLYKEAKKVNFDGSKIKTKCECDCSAFMHTAAIAGGANMTYGSNGFTTSTMEKGFKNSGDYEVLTASKYLTSDKYLKRGDIIVRRGSHTIMALENGSAFKAPLEIAQSIKNIQKFLNEYYGYEIVREFGELLAVDGSFGAKSKKALAAAFQVELNKLGAKLDVDGSFGGGTEKAFTKYVGKLEKGDKGIFVTLLQCLIVGFGYDPNGIDGSFGNGCKTAINKLFGAKGISKDSSVSGADINLLL